MRGGFAIVFLVLAISAAWAEEGWTSLKPRTETVKIEGEKVEIVLTPSFRIAAGGLELQLNAGLADFQRKVPAILNRWAERKSKKCGLRWRFPELAVPKFEAGQLRLAGKVRVEQRACAFGTKTRLWRETASFAIGVAPVAEENRIRFHATLQDFDLGKSVLEDIGAGEEVRILVQGAVQTLLAGDDLSLKFPKKIQEFNPRLTATALTDAGGGNAALSAEAHVEASGAALQGLVKLLLGN